MELTIADLRATTVTVPLEAPLRHSNGAHWGRFVRTIVEVETDDGLVGLGEMGGGGESAPRPPSAGCGPTSSATTRSQLEALRFMIANPTASLYNNRTQLLAAIEFACLDLHRPGARRARVTTCSAASCATRCRSPRYLFFRYPNDRRGARRGAHARPAGRARARS